MLTSEFVKCVQLAGRKMKVTAHIADQSRRMLILDYCDNGQILQPWHQEVTCTREFM